MTSRMVFCQDIVYKRTSFIISFIQMMKVTPTILTERGVNIYLVMNKTDGSEAD